MHEMMRERERWTKELINDSSVKNGHIIRQSVKMDLGLNFTVFKEESQQVRLSKCSRSVNWGFSQIVPHLHQCLILIRAWYLLVLQNAHCHLHFSCEGHLMERRVPHVILQPQHTLYVSLTHPLDHVPIHFRVPTVCCVVKRGAAVQVDLLIQEILVSAEKFPETFPVISLGHYIWLFHSFYVQGHLRCHLYFPPHFLFLAHHHSLIDPSLHGTINVSLYRGKESVASIVTQKPAFSAYVLCLINSQSEQACKNNSSHRFPFAFQLYVFL